jgi:hypothetical protein
LADFEPIDLEELEMTEAPVNDQPQLAKILQLASVLMLTQQRISDGSISTGLSLQDMRSHFHNGSLVSRFDSLNVQQNKKPLTIDDVINPEKDDKNKTGQDQLNQLDQETVGQANDTNNETSQDDEVQPDLTPDPLPEPVFQKFFEGFQKYSGLGFTFVWNLNAASIGQVSTNLTVC